MSNPSKVGPATYADMALEKLNTINWVAFGPLARTNMRNALIEAVNYGMTLYPPPFPPDRERISELNREIVRLEAMVELSKSIMEEKDTQIRQYKDATKHLPLYEVMQRLDDPASTGLRDTITRLNRRIGELTEGRDSRIDHLEALLQRQRDRIAALESNPTNEEARFNIERQYEREMTNVTHLTGKIFDQSLEIDGLSGKVTRLQAQLDSVIADRDRIRREFSDFQKQNPDLEKTLRETAERIANQPWKGYESIKSDSINVSVDNYLKAPGTLDSE